MIHVGLLRGINVGGRNRLPMEELVAVLKSLGATDVKTYIQSGNVVLKLQEGRSDEFSRDVSAEIKKHYGFEPLAFFLRRGEFIRAIENNPFPQAESKPARVHLFFLQSRPQDPDFDRLNHLKSPGEQFLLCEKVLYLYAPDGIGRSRLAGSVEKALGIQATARNWRTVCKLRQMLED